MSDPETVLVDTDVFSYSLKSDTRAQVYKKHIQGKLVALSFITVGELYFWAAKRKWAPRKLADPATRIGATVIVPYDLAICQMYGDLRAKLEAVGRKVADNDLWIAASAVRHSIPLVSNNRSHFEGIPDLVLRSEAPVVGEIQSQGDLKEIPGFVDPA